MGPAIPKDPITNALSQGFRSAHQGHALRLPPFGSLGGGKRFYVKDRGIKLPVVGGHEIFGTIAKVGPDAEGLVSDDIASLDVGSQAHRVSLARLLELHWLGEGQSVWCPAKIGNASAWWSGRETWIRPWCELLAVRVSQLSELRVEILPLPADDPVLLIGAGGVELAATSALRAYGHRNIIGVGIGDDKLAAASKAGATTVINSSQGGPAKAITEACGGPFLSVIDFVNHSKTSASP